MTKTFNYSEEEIQNKIEEIYNTEKGKKFISHLIRSFFPVNKALYLFDDPEDKSKLKCCITEHPLMSKQTALSLSIGNIDKGLKLFTKAILAEGEEKEKALQEKQDNLNEVYQGRLLAICSKESDKYFAPQVFEAFNNWLTNKILQGDQNINWILKSHRKNEALKYAKSKNISITPKEEKTFNKAVNNPAKMNLGDNDILRGLAEKFKTDTNN